MLDERATAVARTAALDKLDSTGLTTLLAERVLRSAVALARGFGRQLWDEFAPPALKDVFFESGHTEIGRQGTVIMRGNAGWLIEHSTVLVLIEGHSDWKGPADANMAVGERRALAARDFLVKAGVSDSRIQVVSHGSERPVCPQRTEACAARNRRVHFLVTSK